MKRFIVLAVVVALVLSGCSTVKQDTVVNESVDVYFALKGNAGLDMEQRSIQYKTAEEKFQNALQEWLKGPTDKEKFEKSTADTVKVLGVKIEQDKLTVDLSKDFNVFGGIMQESATIASLVNTMVQFADVNLVRIQVEGKDLIAPSGDPYGYMSQIDFDPQGQGAIGSREVTLYFSDDQAINVVAEKRTFNIEENAPNDKLVRVLIEELIKGPKTQGLGIVIPAEARVNSVIVEGERATIDFSEEMLTKHSRGAAGEDMTLTSIANTVTEIEGIREVVLTLNGQPLIIEHVIVDSNNPLVRAEDRIKK